MQPRSSPDVTGGEEVQEAGACFECGAPTRTDWRLHAFKYGMEAAAVDLTVTLPVRVCGSCGFEFLDHEAETLEHNAICAHLGVLSPREVREIRESHGMSRAAFSRTTGLGEATLNRWEKGILIQNRANDRYLRLLASSGNLQRLRELDSSEAPPFHTGRPGFRCLDESAMRRAREASFELVRA